MAFLLKVSSYLVFWALMGLDAEEECFPKNGLHKVEVAILSMNNFGQIYPKPHTAGKVSRRMGGKRMDFFEKLDHHNRKESELAWQGTFRDYIELVKEKPYVTQLAHARIYNMIVTEGVEETNGVKRYKFFSHEIFGLDRTLETLVEEYFHSAAKRTDVRKRILLLMGPVSGGKSTIVMLLKRGLERFTRTDYGAVYAIKGCPMHEEPLHLIPKELRGEFQREYNVYIEGSLCPHCRMRLETEWGGRIEDVPVERIFLSEENRVGIGTFSPSDPKSQDIADLTGSVDFSTIAEFGSESDPRAYRFDGELNKANRGLMEFQNTPRATQRA